jgi:type II secretion system protein J
MMEIDKHDKLFLKAFTLLELIIAAAIMNIIALTLYSSMYIGVKARRSSTNAMRPYRLITPIFESIKIDLKSVVGPAGLFAGKFQGDNADGLNQSDSLVFCCCNYYPDEGQKASNIVKVEYVIEDDSEKDNYVLTRKITTNLLSSKTAETEDRIICRGITFLDFRYYDGYNWVDSWNSTTNNKLPKAVQVSFSILENDDLKSGEKIYQSKDFTKIIYLAHSDESTEESTNVQEQ